MNKVNESRLVKLRKRTALTVQFFLFYSIPQYAFAGPIEDITDWVLELLTNGIARTVAIIAIAVLGYMAFFAKLTWEKSLSAVAGIVLVFGSAALADIFIGTVA